MTPGFHRTSRVYLAKEHGLRVCENRKLRRIFGPRREEVAGGWRRLHNEELHNLYASPSIVWMRWTVHVARLQNFGGKP
jgi:hypothetical protein